MNPSPIFFAKRQRVRTRGPSFRGVCDLGSKTLLILLLLVGASCRRGEVEKMQMQLVDLGQERDRLLAQQKTERDKTDAQVAETAKVHAQLQQCEALVLASRPDVHQKRKAFLSQSRSQTGSPSRAGTASWEQRKQDVLAARKQFELASAAVQEAQQALEKADKALAKQKRSLNKEEDGLLQQTPGSAQYSKAQRVYEKSSARWAELTNSQIEAVKRLSQVREAEAQSRARFFAAVDQLLQPAPECPPPAQPST